MGAESAQGRFLSPGQVPAPSISESENDLHPGWQHLLGPPFPSPIKESNPLSTDLTLALLHLKPPSGFSKDKDPNPHCELPAVIGQCGWPFLSSPICDVPSGHWAFLSAVLCPRNSLLCCAPPPHPPIKFSHFALPSQFVVICSPFLPGGSLCWSLILDLPCELSLVFQTLTRGLFLRVFTTQILPL